jgi:large subunit ribosomal protein L15
MELHSLENTSRPYKRCKRVGRGIGSGLGKTCGRGHKGASSRSGWKKRERYEGGQLPLYRKLPTRGFSNVRFQRRYHCINLGQIDQLFSDGDVVNVMTLHVHGFLKGTSYGIKVLSDGDLTKKVTIEAQSISQKAQEKLEQAKIPFTIA